MTLANSGHSSSLPPSEGESNQSTARARYQADQHGVKTREWLSRDAEIFFHQSLSTPCLDVITSAKGSCLHTQDGRTLLDFHGNSVHQVGFGHPKVIEAVTEAMHSLPFSPRRYTNHYAVELAENLAARIPGEDKRRVLFVPGGAEAIGVAMDLARHVTGRYKALSLWESFHGATREAVSAGGEALFRHGNAPLLPGVFHAPPPDPPNCPLGCGQQCTLHCADYLEYILEKEGDIGVVLAETIRCTPVIPPQEWWSRVQAACRKHGALLIIDEIPIGLGRTGKFFAFEHYDLDPDIVALGKGLGGGVIPMAGIVARAGFNDAIAHRAIGHFTHEKSPVGAAAALAALSVIDSEALVERAASLGDRFLNRLRALQKRFDCISDVRGLGLVLGVELRIDGRKAEKLAETVLYECLKRGLSFKISMGNILNLMPPLILTDEEFETAMAILEEAISNALQTNS